MAAQVTAQVAKRALIAAGGTGGHFYPGLVLAKALRERGWQPLMLVRKGDAALPRLEQEGVASCEIDLSGLPRRLSPELLRFGAKLFSSLGLLRRVVRDFAPRVVVGMGGYLTFPAVLCAARGGVPRVVHEANAVLGLANRLSVGLGARLFWGLPPLDSDRGGKVVGTPIRPALWQRGSPEQARKSLGLSPSLPTVLVFGGSQGARGINRGLPPALAQAPHSGGIQVLHLAGAKEAEEVKAAYARAGVAAHVLPYLEKMEWAYAAADLAVCRAGASTLAELAAQSVPAVLVPFPSAAAGHQEANARVLERAGAAAVLLEKDLAARLPSLLGDLVTSPESQKRRLLMSQAYARLGLPAPAEASERLADAVEEICPQNLES